jgi:hypothetical protein
MMDIFFLIGLVLGIISGPFIGALIWWIISIVYWHIRYPVGNKDREFRKPNYFKILIQ